MPSIERSYLVIFQDWIKWLENDIVDYVVAMDYTEDLNLMKLYARSILFPELKDRIYIGIGAYLLKDTQEKLVEEINIAEDLSPGGIVLFSYDELAASKELQTFLKNQRVKGQASGVNSL